MTERYQAQAYINDDGSVDRVDTPGWSTPEQIVVNGLLEGSHAIVKNHAGEIEAWDINHQQTYQPWTHSSDGKPAAFYRRVGTYEDVDQAIMATAMMYLVLV